MLSITDVSLPLKDSSVQRLGANMKMWNTLATICSANSFTKKQELHSPPPPTTKDSLLQHIERMNYQTYIRKMPLIRMPVQIVL